MQRYCKKSIFANKITIIFKITAINIILAPHCDIQSSVLNNLQITNDCQLKVKAKGIIRRDYLRIWRNCSIFAGQLRREAKGDKAKGDKAKGDEAIRR